MGGFSEVVEPGVNDDGESGPASRGHRDHVSGSQLFERLSRVGRVSQADSRLEIFSSADNSARIAAYSPKSPGGSASTPHSLRSRSRCV